MTGLIYVAIVALWAAVLIPMWLRRHDDDQARRIERHRMAMGTLATFRGSPDADARSLAARRRRLTLAALATVGALGTAMWLLGFIPGAVTIAMWLPFVVFVPVSVVAERAATRRAAERALAERREERRSRAAASSRRVERPAEERPAAPPTPASRPTATPSVAPVAWDEVFDQTA